MIYLQNETCLAKGTERALYQHPEHQDQGIKIYWHRRRRRNDSNNEWQYSLLLGPCDCVACPIKWVETDLGKGLVVPLIRDADGAISKTLQDVIDEQLMTKTEISNGLLAFKKELLNHAVSVTDVAPSNIMCQLGLDKKLQRLVLVDGFGYSHFFSISKLLPSVSRRKTLRRFNRMFAKHIEL